MRKWILAFLAMALVPACLYAIDGQALINQATVNATGGFPYKITQPGSYKLSGNLITPPNVAAIQFQTSDAFLDLNGFTVTCVVSDLGPITTTVMICISGTNGSFNLSIRNGVVKVKADVVQGSGVFASIVLQGGRAELRDVIVDENALSVPLRASLGIIVGPHSIVRNNILQSTSGSSAMTVVCPSVVVENHARLLQLVGSCAESQNTTDAGPVP